MWVYARSTPVLLTTRRSSSWIRIGYVPHTTPLPIHHPLSPTNIVLPFSMWASEPPYLPPKKNKKNKKNNPQTSTSAIPSYLIPHTFRTILLLTRCSSGIYHLINLLTVLWHCEPIRQHSDSDEIISFSYTLPLWLLYFTLVIRVIFLSHKIL